MIGDIINKFDKFLGVLFFNSLNTFSYNLFNFFYNKKILMKDIIGKSKIIEKFDKEGFVQIKNIDLNKINKLNEELSKQKVSNSKENRFEYRINDNAKQIIRSIISKDCKIILDDLKKYYNSNIYLGHVMITRNFNYDEKQGESYSSYFHCDGYLSTYFKILINLSDVDSNMGPINVLSKKKTKEDINIFRYNKRSHIKEDKIKSEIFKNTSTNGTGLLISTPQCLHKAGVPNKNFHRDMLFLVFCAYPNRDPNIFSYEKEKDSTIWEVNSELVRRLGKPYGYKKLIKLYHNFINEKLY